MYFYINYIDFIIKQIQYKYASLLNLMSCIDLYLIEKFILQLFLYLLRKHKWIWKGNFNPMFSTTSATS